MAIAFSPLLQLETLLVLDASGRILHNREPQASPGPLFMLIRSANAVAWAVHSCVSSDLAAQVAELAEKESPSADLRQEPRHAGTYRKLLGSRINAGPAFVCPSTSITSGGTAMITSLDQLTHNFKGWRPEEISGCAPILGVFDGANAVSVCFSARLSSVAAEAGVETAPHYRGKGFAPRVVRAWARTVRDSSRLPIYSTSWDNGGSLAVARKLELESCASDWSIDG